MYILYHTREHSKNLYGVMASKTATPASTESKEKKDKKKRINAANEVGLSISLPRIRTVIEKAINDEPVKLETKQLKSRLEAVTVGKPDPAGKLDKKQLEELLKESQSKSIRLQAGAPMAMTALINIAVCDTCIATFDHCQGLKKPTNLVKPAHMYAVLENKKVLTALFMLSDAFENKVHKDDKEDAAKTDENANLNSDEKKTISKQGFITYIGHLISEIKTDKKYKDIRVSSNLKDALDKFIKDVVTVLAEIAKNLCSIDEVRTITAIHLVKALESQMIARRINSKDYEQYLIFMRQKVTQYKELKDKIREDKMTPDEKAARDKKVAESKIKKQQAQAEKAKKKAEDKARKDSEKDGKAKMNGTSKKE